jgi:purine-binding chemotaxis protein CheW
MMTDSGLKNKKESYITFLINDEHYAITVARVTELLEMVPITKVPKAPTFMRGIINLRGEVIPIVDSRIKFSLPEVADTIDTCIVVLHVEIDTKSVKVGVIVDSVSEVVEIDEADILPLPSINNYGKTGAVVGVIKLTNQVTMVLDMDKVFQTDLIELDHVGLVEGLAH